MKVIQIVEDNQSLSNGIAMTLGNSDTTFIKSGTITDAKRDFESSSISAIILDINLPDGNGFDFLKWVRAKSDVPVLILTANDLEMDEVMGFELGADDYVTKPFSLAILRARVSALLRRGSSKNSEVTVIDLFKFNFENSEFEKDNKKIILSPTEQKLLKLLVNNRGQLLTRELLFERLWGNDGDFIDENALSVTVNRLRSKLGDSSKGVSYIQTVYGQGYIWKKKGKVNYMFHDRTMERLNRMLDDGIAGTFKESEYSESKMSRLEAKWKQYLEQSALSKANLDKERENLKALVSDVSHQTKTPMTNILMYSELLKEHLQQNGDNFGMELVQEIIRQTEKLDFLIDCLTKVSRLESGIVDIVSQNDSLSELLNSVIFTMKPKAEKKKITLITNFDESVFACFDMKWTKEALENIIDNAVKYSPNGSQIHINVKEYEMYAEIIIRDEGIGIAEEEIPKIFGRFYRGTAVHSEEGVGIGLFLAREIVRRENGYIKVKSEVGKGSSFSVFLKK